MSRAARPPASTGRHRKSAPTQGGLSARLSPVAAKQDALLPFRSFASAMAQFPGSTLDPRLSLDL